MEQSRGTLDRELVEYVASGLTIAQFCKPSNVSPSTFYYWRKTVATKLWQESSRSCAATRGKDRWGSGRTAMTWGTPVHWFSSLGVHRFTSLSRPTAWILFAAFWNVQVMQDIIPTMSPGRAKKWFSRN